MMPALTLTNLAAYSLQVAAIIAIGAAALSALRVQVPGVRLACLRAMLLACLVLPFVASTPPPPALTTTAGEQPRVDLQTTVVGRGFSPATAGVSRPPAGKSASAWQAAGTRLLAILPIVLVAGVAGRVLWLAVGLVALRRLRRRATLLVRVESPSPTFAPTRGAAPTEIGVGAIADASELVGAGADFLTSRAVNRPVTFGVRRPAVLLPETFASLDETEQVAIATHELLHVRRRDWLQTIGEELLRALFWFHPAVWWLLGQIDLGREQIVDQQVVTLTERRQPYLNALVRLALVPAGPVLRPASLFLGRAHLVKRVALLSREVRMSRWRLAISVVLVAAALVLGGHLVVQAFPLTAAAERAVVTPLRAVNAPPPAFNPPSPTTPMASVLSAPDGGGSPPPAADAEAPRQTPSSPTARVVQSFPPTLGPGNVEPGKDAVVTVEATVGLGGMLAGPVSLYADNGKGTASASDPTTADRIIDGRMMPAPVTAQMHAALDALRMWRFEAPPTPATVYVGFNFAADQAGSFEPVRVGATVKQPVRVKDVRPVYPEEAQNRRIQGVVILELLIDGNTGIPAQGIALRPVGPLTIAALEAALQWRFVPTPEYPRIMMTVTVNFTLSNGVAGGVSGGLSGGVSGGAQGAVAGGVAGGIAGGTQLSIPAGWPAPIRVGGNIKPPTKIKDVRPVYPQDAINAHVQGVVIVEALIGPDGKVADVRILRSIPLLDQAAFDAVQQWQFTPTLLNGTPVPVIMTATVNFTLEGPEQPREVMPEKMGAVVDLNGNPAGADATSGVYRPGPGVTIPRVLSAQKPSYEPTAHQEKLQGTVVVEAIIGPDGAVQDVKVVKPLDPRLDQKAIEAAYQWRFAPGTKNGVPVPVQVTIELMFTLR